jgi:hypothetical protein
MEVEITIGNVRRKKKKFLDGRTRPSKDDNNTFAPSLFFGPPHLPDHAISATTMRLEEGRQNTVHRQNRRPTPTIYTTANTTPTTQPFFRQYQTKRKRGGGGGLDKIGHFFFVLFLLFAKTNKKGYQFIKGKTGKGAFTQ